MYLETFKEKNFLLFYSSTTVLFSKRIESHMAWVNSL